MLASNYAFSPHRKTIDDSQLCQPRKKAGEGQSVDHWIDPFAEFAMGVVMWTPDGFWNSTVYDIERALEGWRRANGITEDKADTPDDIARRLAWLESLPETM